MPNPAASEQAWLNFRRRIAELGGTVLEQAWLGGRTPHRVRCAAGHISSPTPANVKNHRICQICIVSARPTKGLCSVTGCTRPHLAKGFCNTHYRRYQQTGTPGSPDVMPMNVPFWNRVCKNTPNECWPFRGGDRRGYGVVSINGKLRGAPRVAYELTYGPIPPGLVVRHSCDNPPCCNPAHLSTGTQQENIREMFNRKRDRHSRR